MTCIVCGDPEVYALGRCHTCWRYYNRNGYDRDEKLIARLTERDVERHRPR